MNKVILIGRLTQDVKITTASTMFARYSLAVDRKYKREGQPTADFINCVAFGKQAEFAQKYLSKGQKIGVIGRIQTGSYKAKDGRTVYTTDVVVDEHEFVTSKADKAAESVTEAHVDTFMDAADEELPFE